jgi:23S rRNA (uracil1939-C5)-methyltransferase
MEKLYDKAAEYADLKGGETVLDLYCGAGTIGLWMLEDLRKRSEEAFEKTRVIGIESVKPAVLDANRNSVINGVINTRYICGKAEEELPGMMGLGKLYKWNEVNERVEREPEIKLEHADVAVLDPPRAGCAEPLLDAVVQAAPDRIVYVSCDPGTLARDIKYPTANGYDFIEATPVDQFPWTSHIEVVARIQKKKR